MIISPPRETYRRTFVGRIALSFELFSAAILLFLIGSSSREPAFFYIATGCVALNVVLWIVMSRKVLTIHDEGIRQTTAFGVKEIAWRDVVEYRYRSQRGHSAGYHFGGALVVILMWLTRRQEKERGAGNTFYLRVISSDTKISVTSAYQNSYDAVKSIVERIHQSIEPRISSEVASTGATFGPLRLTARDLQWKSGEPVALAEISHACMVGSALHIQKSGKFMSVVNVRSDEIPNVLLLLEQMRKVGVTPEVRDPLASMIASRG